MLKSFFWSSQQKRKYDKNILLIWVTHKQTNNIVEYLIKYLHKYFPVNPLTGHRNSTAGSCLWNK